jgi:cytochrome c
MMGRKHEPALSMGECVFNNVQSRQGRGKMKMKSTIFALSAVVVSLYGISTAMAAEAMPETAKKAGCTACHAVDKKVVGPAWAWVADKYKGDKTKGKEAILHQIVNGGKGLWTKYTGGVPMPPYGPRTTEAQRNELADFILSPQPMTPPEK